MLRRAKCRSFNSHWQSWWLQKLQSKSVLQFQLHKQEKKNLRSDNLRKKSLFFCFFVFLTLFKQCQDRAMAGIMEAFAPLSHICNPTTTFFFFPMYDSTWHMGHFYHFLISKAQLTARAMSLNVTGQQPPSEMTGITTRDVFTHDQLLWQGHILINQSPLHRHRHAA